MKEDYLSGWEADWKQYRRFLISERAEIKGVTEYG
jgi:hypothetical protein